VGFDTKLAEDVQYLRDRHDAVEVIEEGARTLIIVREIELPLHWNQRTTDLLIQVPQGYPLAALDMFWVTPGLVLSDGRQPQNADQMEAYAGRVWQRFSWHYPPEYQWNPTRDGILSHMRFARSRLSQAN
jgi:hypothetical protein